MISRIAISDVSPAIFFGGEFIPVKAVPHEQIKISATAVIEGHEKLTAEVVVHNASGRVVSRHPMLDVAP